MVLWIIGFGLLVILVALAVIDYRTMLLPDILTLPLIVGGLVFAYYQNALLGGVLGVAVGYLGLVVIEISYKKIRGIDGIGRGDAKLLAAGGAWCGLYGLPFILLIASASGLIHALLISRHNTENTKLPFGPHLALGIFISWLALFVIS